MSRNRVPIIDFMQTIPFWRRKSLDEMTRAEWESLCDHCGKCCLHKLEDEESGKIYYTNVVCSLLDFESGCCTRYSERSRLVPSCLTLSTDNIPQLHWMPISCAYRLIAEGEDLPDWHPLRSNDPDSVVDAGVSVRAYAIPDSEVDDLDSNLEQYIIEWLE